MLLIDILIGILLGTRYRKVVLDILRSARIQTACITQSLFIIPLLMADIPLVSYYTLLAIICGILVHASGFLHNGLCDLRYDKVDNAKSTHPLVTGKISEVTGWQVCIVLHTLATLFVAYLIMLLGKSSVVYVLPYFPPVHIGFTLLLLSIIFGWLYNIYSKKSLLAYLCIPTCFALIPLYVYVSAVGYISIPIVLVFVFLWIYEFLQNSVCGGAKDSKTDSFSFVNYMGKRATQFTMIVSKLALLIVLFYIIVIGGNIWYAMISLSLFVLSTLLGEGIIDIWNEGRNRDKLMKVIVAHEVTGYMMLVFALGSWIGWQGTVFLVIYPILWFITFNRILWKDSYFVPSV